MKYDHSAKIGNRGDVIKHAVLAAVVDRLLQDDDKPFSYVETHTGRAEYILPKGGEWRKGIRRLQNRVVVIVGLIHMRPLFSALLELIWRLILRMWVAFFGCQAKSGSKSQSP